MSINIKTLRVGDIITHENPFNGYVYSVVLGIDRVSGTMRHKEYYENGGTQNSITSVLEMSPSIDFRMPINLSSNNLTIKGPPFT